MLEVIDAYKSPSDEIEKRVEIAITLDVYGHPEQALVFLNEALRKAEDRAGTAIGSPAEVGRVKSVMGQFEKDRNPDRAIRLYREAIEAYDGAGDADRAKVKRAYSQFSLAQLLYSKNLEEAERLADEADAAIVASGEKWINVAGRVLRIRAKAAAGKWEEAEQIAGMIDGVTDPSLTMDDERNDLSMTLLRARLQVRSARYQLSGDEAYLYGIASELKLAAVEVDGKKSLALQKSGSYLELGKMAHALGARRAAEDALRRGFVVLQADAEGKRARSKNWKRFDDHARAAMKIGSFLFFAGMPEASREIYSGALDFIADQPRPEDLHELDVVALKTSGMRLLLYYGYTRADAVISREEGAREAFHRAAAAIDAVTKTRTPLEGGVSRIMVEGLTPQQLGFMFSSAQQINHPRRLRSDAGIAMIVSMFEHIALYEHMGNMPFPALAAQRYLSVPPADRDVSSLERMISALKLKTGGSGELYEPFVELEPRVTAQITWMEQNLPGFDWRDDLNFWDGVVTKKPSDKSGDAARKKPTVTTEKSFGAPGSNSSVTVKQFSYD
ncbi:hypothetical protein NUH88_08520 [Nisaea acidiphila]|uniref:Tetratricopeptide repeat protein n=1 Tax=Nisaea acidiphila TaxID=1862145 RepID=A0A9J7AVD7_9PROT|nr:hypothetical protein [Nisaea acidiphila]UUX51731.1 hypothetical protein NUH88_08520 [Nisaea acidiphila]